MADAQADFSLEDVMVFSIVIGGATGYSPQAKWCE
jgi:hypothetical protein